MGKPLILMSPEQLAELRELAEVVGDPARPQPLKLVGGRWRPTRKRTLQVGDRDLLLQVRADKDKA